MKHTIVIGVCSGIAAYKMVDLVHDLRTAGNEMHVAMTDHATLMVAPSEFVKASRHPVHTSLFPEGFDYKDVLETREVEHIRLADSADIVVIAPATANMLGKLAHGLADDFLTTMVMATRAPVLICPSMNVHMWENDAVQENIRLLEKRGYFLLHPDSGKLACGYEGVGRLAASEKIQKEIHHLLIHKNRLKGKKIVITAGGTAEPIDAVRIITNRGSGKMGAALARVCQAQGAAVMLLRSKTAVVCPFVSEAVFETADELEMLVKQHIKDADVFFHTAAVADFSMASPEGKIKSGEPVNLTLNPREKIITKIRKWNPDICLVGFKAEYRLSQDRMIQKAKELIKASRADYVVANDVGRPGVGFAAEDNEVYMVSRVDFLHISRRSKREVAERIVDSVYGYISATAS